MPTVLTDSDLKQASVLAADEEPLPSAVSEGVRFFDVAKARSRQKLTQGSY